MSGLLELIDLGVVVMATSAISLTITKSALFDGLRAYLGKESLLGKLAHCHYCVSHWVAFALVAIFQPEIGTLFRWPALWLVEWFTLSMAVVGVSATISNKIIAGMRSNGQ